MLMSLLAIALFLSRLCPSFSLHSISFLRRPASVSVPVPVCTCRAFPTYKPAFRCQYHHNIVLYTILNQVCTVHGTCYVIWSMYLCWMCVLDVCVCSAVIMHRFLRPLGIFAFRRNHPYIIYKYNYRGGWPMFFCYVVIERSTSCPCDRPPFFRFFFSFIIMAVVGFILILFGINFRF